MRILRCVLIVCLLGIVAAALAQEKPPSPTLMADPTPWTGAPVVLRCSDAVKPGELFMLHGEGLAGEGLSVAVAPGVTAIPPKGTAPARLVYADHKGQFVVVEMPQALKPGQFSVWVTRSGQDAPTAKAIHVNLPRSRRQARLAPSPHSMASRASRATGRSVGATGSSSGSGW